MGAKLVKYRFLQSLINSDSFMGVELKHTKGQIYQRGVCILEILFG